MPSPESKSVEDFTVTLTAANTEYSQAIAGRFEAIEFQARTSAAIRHSFTSGKVATPTAPYNTLKAGGIYTKDKLGMEGKTLYLASATEGTVVEVRVWR